MVNESWKNSETYFKINVSSKTKMLETLSSSKFLEKYIYISTPEIFGSSINILKKILIFLTHKLHMHHQN